MPRHADPGDPLAKEQVEFWRSPALRGLELLQATYITHTFAPHTHDTFVIGAIERGVETFRYRGQKLVAPAGSVVLVNPGEVHTGESPERLGWSYRVLYPPAAYLAEALAQL